MLSDANRKILIEYLGNQMETLALNSGNEMVSDNSRIQARNDDEKKLIQFIKDNSESFLPLLQRWFWQHGHDVLFDLFCVIDGVADPNPTFGKWKGVLLIDKPEDFEQHSDFLHDEL